MKHHGCENIPSQTPLTSFLADNKHQVDIQTAKDPKNPKDALKLQKRWVLIINKLLENLFMCTPSVALILQL